jgi:hypothetical protein
MNPTDGDRAARTQVTLRLERDLLDAIDELAGEEGVDRTELTRRLLADGLAQRRVQTATADYAAGRRSAWSAASRAGVDLYEMINRIADAGIPYRVDPEAMERLRAGGPTTPGSRKGALRQTTKVMAAESSTIAELRARYRPSSVRILFVGESSPAGGTHFYQADSQLYRATREAFGLGLNVVQPPEGAAFLAWFQELGCWLVDLADRPVDRSPVGERLEAVDAGIPGLARLLQELRPVRVIAVLRRIAPAVRRAAQEAGIDDHEIDVIPFPTRQWRPVYVGQLAGIVNEVVGDQSSAADLPRSSPTAAAPSAVAEARPDYGMPHLHEVMADVLREHGDSWVKASAIAREIAAADLWRRPQDGRHPKPSQISARARQYPQLFQTSDLGIRLRRP